MNNGIFDQPQGPPAIAKRIRYELGQGTGKVKRNAVVISTYDDSAYISNSYTGAIQGQDVTDLILQIPSNRSNNNISNVTASGALMVQIPDGTARGGNARGARAVDFQSSRNLSSQVASGTGSIVIGVNNTASSNDSVAIGTNNTASGPSSVAIGATNIASGTYSFAAGYSNTASAIYSFAAGYLNIINSAGQSSVAMGQSNTTNGFASVALGNSCVADGGYSSALGLYANTNGITSKFAYGSGFSLGKTQLGILPLRWVTTDAVATVISSDGFAASVTNQLTLVNANAINFEILVTATVTGTSAVAFKCTGLIRRGATAAATVLVGSTVTQLFADASLAPCVVALSANTTLGCLTVTVTGIAATSISWTAVVKSSEVIG